MPDLFLAVVVLVTDLDVSLFPPVVYWFDLFLTVVTSVADSPLPLMISYVHFPPYKLLAIE